MSVRAYLVIATLALSACSERNAGVGSTADRSVGNNESLAVKQTKAASLSSDRTATTTLPLATTVANALRLPSGASHREPQTQLEASLRAGLAAAATAGPVADSDRELLAQFAAADALRLRGIISDALLPLPAWPVTPVDKAGRLTSEGQRWIAERYAALELANAVISAVAESVKRQPVYDIEDARAKALVAFSKLDHAALLRSYDAWQRVPQVVTVDGQHVGFVLADGTGVEIGTAGPSVSRAGRPWFAADVASGQTYQIALASAASTSMSWSKDMSRDETSSASQKVDATTSVK